MPKDDELKNRLDELFSSGFEETDKPSTSSQPVDVASGSASSMVEEQLNRRIRELDCLSDIGHRIDEHPPLDDFLTWVTSHVPSGMEHPEICKAAIVINNKTYGDPIVLSLPRRIAAGIRIGEELLGYLYMAYRDNQYFLDEESSFIGAVVSRISGYIESIQLLNELQGRTKELTILNEMGMALSLKVVEEEIIESIYTFSSRLVDVENFYVAIYDEINQELSFPIIYTDFERQEPFRRSLRKGMTEYVIRTKEPLLLVENTVEKMQQLGIEFIALGDDTPALSWLGVPMLHLNQVLGIIAIQSIKEEKKYNEHDRNLLLSIARQAAIALANARAFSEVQTTGQKLRSEEESLTHERSLLRTIIDNIPDVVYYKDTQSRMVVANAAQARLLGAKSPDDLVGKTDHDFFPTELAEKYYNDEQEIIKLGRSLIGIEEPTIDILGNKKWISTTKVPLTNELGEIVGIVGMGRDITEKKEAEESIAKRAVELESVAKLSTDISTILDPDELLQTFVDNMNTMFGFYHSQIYLLDKSKGSLTLSAGAGEVGKKLTSQGWEIPLGREQSLVARTARERHGVITNNVELDLGFLRNPLLPETHIEMTVPIIAGEDLLGVLDIQAIKGNKFDEEDLSIHTTLSSQIAVALQNARLYQQVQHSLEEAEALFTGSEHIIHASTSNETLQAIVNSTLAHNFDRANIFMFDEPWIDTPPDFFRVEAVWEADYKTPRVSVGTTYRREQIPYHKFVQRDEPTFIEDVTKNGLIGEDLKQIMIQMGMSSLAVFPLISGDQWIGVVTFQSNKVIDLPDREIRKIDSLVGQAAVVIQNTKLLQSMEDRLIELEKLQRTLSRESWSSYLSNLQDTHRGYLYDQISLQDISISDITRDADAAVNIIRNENTNLPQAINMEYPLQVSGFTIGGLGIVEEERLYITPEDETFLEDVAAQVSQALERARLLEQTQKSAVELQTVAQVSTAASSNLNPQSLLQEVVDLAKTRFGLYHAHIYLLDDTGHRLELTAGSGEIGRSMTNEGWFIEIDEETIVSRAAKTRQGQIVNDVQQEINFLPNPLLPDTTSEMAVPMVVGQRVLGVFDVQSEVVNRFNDADLQTFTTLATQTAVALQNARLYAEQSKTVDRLRELDHLKSSFMANMSHELRTPLNSILGFTQVILEGIDGPLTEYMESDLQLIEKNGQHLLNLINEVLDMAKIESGRMSLSIEPIDLRTLLEDVFETTSTQANDKNLYLYMEADESSSLQINGDSMRLRQVMLNLISNAVKFTEHGGITVKVDRLPEKVSLKFIDTGIGIPPDKLEMVFEAFSQVDSTTTRKAGGTGLGLPISRRLVEMHGGRLWAESSGISGEGSIFTLELPIQPVSK
jgi:PAS domain S-box-containing protein